MMKRKSRSLFYWFASLAVCGGGCSIMPDSGVAAPAPRPSCEHSFRVIRTQDDNGYVNLREGPSVNASIVGTLNNGTEVLFNIGDRSGEWAEITTPWRSIGWVSKQFLVYSPVGSAEFNGSLQVRTLDGSSVNLRNAPGLSAKVLGTVENGAMVQYRGTQGEWLEVSSPDSIRGYISRQYLMCAD